MFLRVLNMLLNWLPIVNLESFIFNLSGISKAAHNFLLVKIKKKEQNELQNS